MCDFVGFLGVNAIGAIGLINQSPYFSDLTLSGKAQIRIGLHRCLVAVEMVITVRPNTNGPFLLGSKYDAVWLVR